MFERTDHGALCAVLLKVRPRLAGLLPAHWGPLIHGGLLAWLREVDPAVAARLHEPNRDRPFTTGALWWPDRRAQATAQQYGQRLPVTPAQTYWLRITLLESALFRPFTQPLLRFADQPALQLGEIPFDIVEVVVTPRPGERPGTTWSGWTTYAELAAWAANLPEECLHTLRLEFDTPTCFSDGDRPWGRRTCVLPEPVRIFARLAHQWRVFAPPTLVGAIDEGAVRAYTAERMMIYDYRLRIQRVHLNHAPQPGFVGWCDYLLPDDDAGGCVRRQVQLLASFAFYAGVGYKTTLGLGRVRRNQQPTKRGIETANQG